MCSDSIRDDRARCSVESTAKLPSFWYTPAVLWGLTRCQWTVFVAAWLGWGFDVFDGLLLRLRGADLGLCYEHQGLDGLAITETAEGARG